ncbi:MAG: hypothetical protein AAGI52_04395 [Bacteroidota bacterium]
MIRFALGLSLAVLLASCDTAGTDSFSLSVSVQDSDGRPVSGLTVALDTELVPGSAQTPTSATTFDLSTPYPNPYGLGADVTVASRGEGPIQVNIFDLEGSVLSHTDLLSSDPTARFAVTISATAGIPAGLPLPGGIYRLRASRGDEFAERGLIRSEGALESGALGIRRFLGVTNGTGLVRTEDRTASPSLYPTLPPLVHTDDVNNELASVRVSRMAAVVVSDGTRTETREVALRDGANVVDVIW